MSFTKWTLFDKLQEELLSLITLITFEFDSLHLSENEISFHLMNLVCEVWFLLLRRDWSCLFVVVTATGGSDL
jgi:hypothetical protein